MPKSKMDRHKTQIIATLPYMAKATDWVFHWFQIGSPGQSRDFNCTETPVQLTETRGR
jgi:hypothetical protein